MFMPSVLRRMARLSLCIGFYREEQIVAMGFMWQNWPDFPMQVIERAKSLLLPWKIDPPRCKNSEAEKGSDQLNLFEWNEPSSNSSEAVEGMKRRGITSIREWDLMNRTPFETMQFLQRCKQRLVLRKWTQTGRRDGWALFTF